MLLYLVFLFHKGIGQNNLTYPTDSMILSNNDSKYEKTNLKNNNYCDELEYKNMVLMMEAKMSEEAYNDLLQKIEKLKSEIKQYQKVIQEFTIKPSTETFLCTNAKSSAILCGESFLEQVLPGSASESSTITYFIAQVFKHAIISLSDYNGVEVANYFVNESGYGQCVINAGELKAGTYNYCLIIDERKLDCKKLILMK